MNPDSPVETKKADSLVVWRAIDGKTGHENQSAGLLEALSRRISIESYDVSEGKLPDKKPSLVLGAGHQTHGRLLLWKWRYGAKAVVLMKPTMPMSLFDVCLVPEHDLLQSHARENVLPTVGVLNRVKPSEKQKLGLILIGGNSKEYVLDEHTLIARVKKLVKADPSVDWIATDSRRTAPDFLQKLEGSGAKLYSHEKALAEWLPSQLAIASKCWVTEDSVSMLYESLSAGASVGLLPMKSKPKNKGRVRAGVVNLVSKGLVTRYDESNLILTQSGQQPLAEADRCADELLEMMGISH